MLIFSQTCTKIVEDNLSFTKKNIILHFVEQHKNVFKEIHVKKDLNDSMRRKSKKQVQKRLQRQSESTLLLSAEISHILVNLDAVDLVIM